MRHLRHWRRNLASDRGSVGVVVALFIFFAMGLMTMTWNTAQLSKAKMRLQNAADAAALAHAVWQARGMNAVQNLNDEMYESLSIANTLLTVAKITEPLATSFDVMGNLPVVGPIFKAIGLALHLVAATTGGIGGWTANRICKYFLKYLALAYARSSSLMGFWNAQQLAAQNEADPLLKYEFDMFNEKWKLGMYTLGFSWPAKDFLMLPLEECTSADMNKPPWKVEKVEGIFEISPQPWKTIYKICRTADGWEIKPYVSARPSKDEGGKTNDEKKIDTGILPGPTMWIAFKLGQNIHTLPIEGFYNTGDSGLWSHKLPMLAISAAQCVTGDVIPCSKKFEKGKTNQRPAGFGVGATAKLVPVSEVFYKMGKGGGVAVDAMIYH